MTTPLRVLIVEDSPDDAESIVLRLEKEGFQLDWQRVQTESDYLAALETPPDLILADWTLPQFSGLHALQRMRQRGLDIPFVIISGTVGEEAAVEALRQGASDYVFKDRLARLGQAVQRALEDLQLRQERQQAEEALRSERDRAQTYLDTASVILVALNTQGEITLINQMGCTILGFEEHDLIGQNWFDNFVAEDIRQVLIDNFNRVLAGEDIGNVFEYHENSVITRSGEKRIIAWHNVVIRDEGNRIIGTLSSGQDVTARKQAEQELRKLSQAVEYSPTIVYITGPNGRLEYVNAKFTEITGYTAREALGRLPRILDPDKISQEEHEERWSVIRSGKEWRGEFQNRKKNGEPFWESVSISSIKNETGTISHFVLVMEDITERKLAEQKLREWNEKLEQRVAERTAELNHTKERIEAILNSSSDLLIMCRMDGAIDQVNPAFEATFNCT